ncbi:unnamed protein product, partial [Rotaria sp. Silwood1]
MFAIAIGSGTPLIVHKCAWDTVPHLQM